MVVHKESKPRTKADSDQIPILDIASDLGRLVSPPDPRYVLSEASRALNPLGLHYFGGFVKPRITHRHIRSRFHPTSEPCLTELQWL